VDALETAVWVMGKAQLGRDLAKEELVDLRAFLESLTGKIPEDALRFPELPVKTSDGKTPSQSVPVTRHFVIKIPGPLRATCAHHASSL